MAARYRITLALVVLGAPLFLKAEALPKHTYLVGGCNAPAREALAIFAEQKAAPRFDLYIVCDSPSWHELAQKNDFKESAHSFTVLHRGMIWLGPKALDNLHQAVGHELEHLRCDCDLGERLSAYLFLDRRIDLSSSGTKSSSGAGICGRCCSLSARARSISFPCSVSSMAFAAFPNPLGKGLTYFAPGRDASACAPRMSADSAGPHGDALLGETKAFRCAWFRRAGAGPPEMFFPLPSYLLDRSSGSPGEAKTWVRATSLGL